MMLLLPSIAFSQPNVEVNKELGLREDLMLGTKIFPNGDYVFLDGYFTVIDVKHQIFDHLKFEYNKDRELTAYTYSCNTAVKTSENKDRILKTLEKYYGKGTHKDSSYNFRKGDEHAWFFEGKEEWSLGFYSYSVIKAIESYDKYEKGRVINTEGYTANQFEWYVGNEKTGERHLWFKGIVSKGAIAIYYGHLPYTTKTIKMQLDNGRTILLGYPTEQKHGNYTITGFEHLLPKTIADKIYRCKKMAMITFGKYHDKVEIGYDILKMYRVIYDALYKKNGPEFKIRN